MLKKRPPSEKLSVKLTSNYFKVGTGEASLRSEFYTEKGRGYQRRWWRDQEGQVKMADREQDEREELWFAQLPRTFCLGTAPPTEG